MTKDEALKLALEALEEAWYHVGTFQPTEKAIDLYDEARTAIKEALAQPEQEQLELPEPRLTGKFSITAGKFKCTGCTGTWTDREDAKHHSCKNYQ